MSCNNFKRCHPQTAVGYEDVRVTVTLHLPAHEGERSKFRFGQCSWAANGKVVLKIAVGER